MKILKFEGQENEVFNLSYSFNQRRTIHDQEKRPFLGIGIFLFFFLLFAGLTTLNAQTVVNSGDNLNTIIGEIDDYNGRTIIVNSGTYDPLLIKDKKFTANNPLIIKAAEGANVIIKREQGNWDYQNPDSQTYDAGVFTRSSYIAIEDINFIGGHRGVTVYRSDHIIFRDCDFTQTQEAGVKVENNSAYIDFIDCLFAYTGIGPNPWFGEALYVGRGSYGNNEDLFPDACKFIWVEGCEFHHTGRAEAINIKAEAFGCTIRGNNIHDITLNDANDLVHRQTNAGAISLDHNLGVRRSNTYVETYKEGDRRENWVEGNTITTVRTGQTTVRSGGQTPTPEIAGIYSAGTGNNITGNTVRDVKNGNLTAAANGIRFNQWSDDITKNYVWANNVSDTDDGDSFGDLAVTQNSAPIPNPNSNPNKAQSWYPIGNNNDNENEGANLRIEAEDGSYSNNLLKSSNEASANEYIGQFSSSGDYVEVSANIETAGQYELRIGYRAPYSDQQNDILIGGQLVNKFMFTESAGFQEASIGTYDFAAGANKITFRKSWGWMDVDYFEIVGASGSDEENPNPIVVTDSSIKIEAEDGTYSNNLFKSSNEASQNEYLGQFSNGGDYVEVSANIETAGQYELKMGYRAPYSNQQNDILIGGQLVKKFEFAQSDNFQEASIGTFDFEAGANKIMFRKSWGWMDVDYFEIVGASGSNGENINPPIVINTGYEIIVNAKGACGGEKMELSINGNVEKEFTLTANEIAYPVSFQGSSIDNVKITFVNDGSSNTCPDLNLFINNIEIDGIVIETEDAALRDGCGNAEWLWCGGSFTFSNLNFKLVGESEQGSLTLFPNPLSSNSLYVTLSGLKVPEEIQVSIYSVDGSEMYTNSVISSGLIHLTDIPDLDSGIYMVHAVTKKSQYQAKLNIQ